MIAKIDEGDLVRPGEVTKKSSCGQWAVVAECSTGLHHFAKKIYCGKEWCPVCGAHRSAAHNRRIARVLKKAMQIESMGYLVIEFPDIYRTIGQKGINPDEIDNCWCYSKKDLKATTDIIVRVLAGKRTSSKRRSGGYFKRGLARWHWFGDKVPGKWNPHCNILVDSGFIDTGMLEKIKSDLRTALNCPDLIVHYSYCEHPGQKFQKVEYITRATFLDESWNEYMASELFNFRNQRWWGEWKDDSCWSAEDANIQDMELVKVMDLQEGKCPDCGAPLKVHRSPWTGRMVKWSRPIDSIYIDIIWQSVEIAQSGYYRISHRAWCDGPLAAKQILTSDDIMLTDRTGNINQSED